MSEDDPVEFSRLPIRLTPDGRLLETRPALSNNPGETYWTRQEILAHPPADNVFHYKSSDGESWVVKQIRRQDGTLKYRRELEMMKRVMTDTTPDEKKLFVELIGWFLSPDYIHFALEYCVEGDFSRRPTPMLERDVWCVCNQLMQGLSVLHRIGIIHRDIKPQNVLVYQVNPIQVKIADFGISKLSHNADGRIATHPTTKVGTFGYSAPERLDMIERAGSSHTPAVDMWSLGCLIHYGLTGSLPFAKVEPSTHNWYGALLEYCKGNIPFPNEPLAENGVSLSGQQFIQRLLAPAPEERPKASQELMNDWVFAPLDDLPSLTLASKLDGPQDPSKVSDNTARPTELFLPSDLTGNENDQASSDLWSLVKLASRGPVDMEKLQSLLSSDASPDVYIKGYTALQLAAEKGTAEVVRELLHACKDPNARTMETQAAAIHLATVQADFTVFKEKLELLLQKHADIDITNAEGETVLHLAIRTMENAKAINFLLEHGSSTTPRGRHGRTPLQYAVYLEKEEFADVLLSHGADPSCEDNDGATPLHIAVKSKKLSASLVERLIGKGFHINHEDNNSRTPLFEAANFGRPDFIRLLIDRGARCWPHSAKLEARISRAYERPVLGFLRPWLP